jgi:hypothetical protein
MEPLTFVQCLYAAFARSSVRRWGLDGIQTYTMESESGTSLCAAGGLMAANAVEVQWNHSNDGRNVVGQPNRQFRP